MAQLLLQGTNFVNFMGQLRLRGDGKDGFEAVAVAEHDEPQAVIGSDLHKLAYPERLQEVHDARPRAEEPATSIAGKTSSTCSCAASISTPPWAGGFRIYDIANIDNKDFSEHIITAPVSPLGQRLYVKTKYADRCRLAHDAGGRSHCASASLRTKSSRSICIYAFLYVADTEEGLVVVGNPDRKPRTPGVGTLLDGDPANNFLERALTFNPDGMLTGARRITIAGTYAYILCDRGLASSTSTIRSHPKVAATSARRLKPRGIAIQFRYAFVVDRDGLKVLDVTDLRIRSSCPKRARADHRRAQHLRRAHLRLRRRAASKDS